VTIFVDQAFIAADVPNGSRVVSSRWCHLMSDDIDPAELHAFAARIGLRRAWFQRGKRLGRPDEHDPAGDHYDVTAGKRRMAVAAGAVEIDRNGLVALMRKRRAAVQAHA
jgi:uncharacterized protein DUF4031